MITKKAFTCGKCNQTVYARTIYDLHTCYCCNISCKGEHLLGKGITEIQVEVDATERELELDFYYNIGKFGTIKN